MNHLPISRTLLLDYACASSGGHAGLETDAPMLHRMGCIVAEGEDRWCAISVLRETEWEAFLPMLWITSPVARDERVCFPPWEEEKRGRT